MRVELELGLGLASLGLASIHMLHGYVSRQQRWRLSRVVSYHRRRRRNRRRRYRGSCSRMNGRSPTRRRRRTLNRHHPIKRHARCRIHRRGRNQTIPQPKRNRHTRRTRQTRFCRRRCRCRCRTRTRDHIHFCSRFCCWRRRRRHQHLLIPTHPHLQRRRRRRTTRSPKLPLDHFRQCLHTTLFLFPILIHYTHTHTNAYGTLPRLRAHPRPAPRRRIRTWYPNGERLWVLRVCSNRGGRRHGR